MHSPLRPRGHRIQRGQLAWQIDGKRPSCPRSLAPTQGESALEIRAHARVDPLSFNDSMLDTLVRRQTFEATREVTERVQHHDAAFAGLPERRIESLHLV